MKLYYATGTCSLSPHIVALEAGIRLETIKVNISRTPHTLEGDREFSEINPNDYVPVLELEDGSILAEGVAIVQFLADLKPASGLIPKAGTHDRYIVQSWLNFISTELHKMYSPWLFHPEFGPQAQDVARLKLAQRLAYVDAHLSKGNEWLLGSRFSVADAYLFTIVGWSNYAKVSLAAFPHLRAFMASAGARPKVREAMAAEGMKVAA